MSSQRLGQGIEKTLWKGRSQILWSFFCPLCKGSRKVPFRSKLAAIQFFRFGLTAVVFTMVFWNFFHLKGLYSVFLFWAIFDAAYWWRLRAALPCPQCGFDPYLFLIDEKWAKKEVEAHWRKKFAEKGIPYPERKGAKPLESPPPGL